MEENMKRPEICFLILVMIASFSLVACSPDGIVSNKMNCSSGGELCITTSVNDTIQFGGPVKLSIKVTSSKDMSDLEVSIHSPSDFTVDGPQGWENFLTYASLQPGYAIWTFDIKAGQTLTFNRVLHFPSKEGYFDIIVVVVNPGGTLIGTDSFTVHMTKNGGVIYGEGTSLPPEVPYVTLPVYGPGTPYPTFLPTETRIVMPTPMPTQFSPLAATSTGPSYPGVTPYP
jgi:hypothetical protein